MAPLLIFTFLSVLCATSAENRAHGLDNESPTALSPSAYTFFNPNTLQPSTNNPCFSSECSSLPLTATVQSSLAHESTLTSSRPLAVGGIIGIPLVFVFTCLITAGVYYIVIKRQAKSRRSANPQQHGEV